MKKKLLILLPLLTMVVTGCKGNTWSIDSSEPSSEESEPEPLSLFLPSQTIVAGQSLTIKLLGDYDEDDVELEVGPTKAKVEVSAPLGGGRYRIETGPDWGDDFTLTAKSGNQQASESVRVYGARPDEFYEYGDHDYLYPYPTALGFNGYALSNAYFKLYTEYFTEKRVVFATLQLNGITQEYYLSHYFVSSDSYLLNPMNDVNRATPITVKHEVDYYGRGNFNIVIDENHSLRVGEANWQTPTLDDVEISFDNKDRNMVAFNTEDVIYLNIETGYPYDGSFNPDYFSFTYDAPIDSTVDYGDREIFMRFKVTDSDFIGENITIHFHFQYYLFTMDKDFTFHVYDSEDQSLPPFMKTNIVGRYNSVVIGSDHYSAYAIWLQYDETISGYHAYTVNEPAYNPDAPREFEYMEWEIEVTGSGYQYNGYHYGIKLVSYSGYKTSFVPGVTVNLLYDYVEERGYIQFGSDSTKFTFVFSDTAPRIAGY